MRAHLGRHANARITFFDVWRMVKGYDLDTAVRRAKDYLSGALAAMLDLGAGSGPMDHAFDLKPEYRQEAQA